MNVVLVNPPNHRHDLDDLAPPLGLLMLAESLIEIGAEVTIIDLNLDSCRDALPPVPDFYPVICDRILAVHPQIVGFTSMGINSHVALEIARRLKCLKPSLLTVFGGPHFGSIAMELPRAFPWVDYVSVGAGESSIKRLVLGLQRGDISTSRLLINETPNGVQQLRHPRAAYGLIDISEYFSLNPRRVLNFETGRGCKFKCKFCYSPAHWKQTFDFALSPILEDFKAASQLGAKHLFLVQDNLLNNQLSAAALCLNLADMSPKPSWNCYGTLREVNDDVTGYLARGGCIGIYMGIDAVTPLQKRQFGKSSFKREIECLEKVQALVASSITPTCAFILDPLNWSDDELEATFRLATTLRLNGAELSLHFLTTYNNTGLSRSAASTSVFIPDDFRIRLMFDCPEIVLQNSLVANSPFLFPFHTRSTTNAKVYQRGAMLIQLAQHLISTYPHEISDLISSSGPRIVDILAEVLDNSQHDLQQGAAASKLAASETLEKILCKTYGFVPIEHT